MGSGAGNGTYLFAGFTVAMAMDYIGRAYAFPGKGVPFFSDPPLDLADVLQVTVALGGGILFGALAGSDMVMSLMYGALASQGYTKWASDKFGLPRYIIAREAIPL